MTLKIADIMTRRFHVVPESQGVGSTDTDMSMAGAYDCLVIDDNGKLAGVVSKADVQNALERGARGSIAGYMRRRMWTARLGDDAIKATDLMLEHHTNVVPVVDDETRPVGLIGLVEILRIARARLTEPER